MPVSNMFCKDKAFLETAHNMCFHKEIKKKYQSVLAEISILSEA